MEIAVFFGFIRDIGISLATNYPSAFPCQIYFLPLFYASVKISFFKEISLQLEVQTRICIFQNYLPR